ncbi:MAG: DUF1330 domain-containing protein [Acidimicrobiales bacterium]|jgi:uncharacterized protein (DUF1330 family)
MAAYVIAEITVTDAEGYESYKLLAEESIHAHGGRYLVRGGTVDSLEGAPAGARIVVLEFPDLETARSWYRSDDYQAAARARQVTSTGRLFLAEGLSTPG